MTPEARAAAEAAINTALQHLLVLAVLGWWAWYAWRKWGPKGIDLRRYFTMQPRQTLDTAPAAAAPAPAPAPQTDRDRPETDRVSAVDPIRAVLELDRTKKAAVKAFVLAGWSVGEIRSVLKGDNGAIGAEVEQARQELNAPEPPPRTLLVDGKRTIAL